ELLGDVALGICGLEEEIVGFLRTRSEQDLRERPLGKAEAVDAEQASTQDRRGNQGLIRAILGEQEPQVRAIRQPREDEVRGGALARERDAVPSDAPRAAHPNAAARCADLVQAHVLETP